MCAYNRINGVYASRGPLAAHRGAARRVGLRGPRRVRLGRRRRPRRRRRRRPRPRDAVLRRHGDARDRRGRRRAARSTRPMLDQAVTRVLTLVERAQPALAEPGAFDAEAHHALAREAATAQRRPAEERRRDPAAGPAAVAGTIAVDRGVRPHARATRAPAPRRSTRPGSTRRSTRSASAASTCRSRRGYTLRGRLRVEGGPTPTPSSGAEAVAARDRPPRSSLVFVGLPAARRVRGLRPHAPGPARRSQRRPAAGRRAAAKPDVVVVLSNGSAVDRRGLARPGRRDPRGLAARPGRRRRDRRPAARRRRALGPARRDHPGAARGQPGTAALPRRARPGALRRGPVHRLPRPTTPPRRRSPTPSATA